MDEKEFRRFKVAESPYFAAGKPDFVSTYMPVKPGPTLSTHFPPSTFDSLRQWPQSTLHLDLEFDS